MRRRIALCLVALVVSACGASSDDATNQAAAPTGEAGSTSFALVGGGTIDLADYAEQDLALWFWTPW